MKIGISKLKPYLKAVRFRVLKKHIIRMEILNASFNTIMVINNVLQNGITKVERWLFKSLIKMIRQYLVDAAKITNNLLVLIYTEWIKRVL